MMKKGVHKVPLWCSERLIRKKQVFNISGKENKLSLSKLKKVIAVNPKSRENLSVNGVSSLKSLSYLNITHGKMETIIVSKLILKTPEKIGSSFKINNISSIKFCGNVFLSRDDLFFEENMEVIVKSGLNISKCRGGKVATRGRLMASTPMSCHRLAVDPVKLRRVQVRRPT